MDVANKHIALLGFGVENSALLPYLQKHGASVTICDKNEDLPRAITSVEYRLGKDYLTDLRDFEIVFRTPGLPYLTKEIQEARRQGVMIRSQTQLFLEACKGKVVGVTGTKGKGTTASLIESILTEAGKNQELRGNVYLTGNIGVPAISVVDTVTEDDWVILELSSFQLHDITKSPHIAVVLNITVDHLDHHRDEAEYISAKKNIVRYQTPNDYLVVNLDSLTSILFAEETPAKTYFYSRENSVDRGVFVERRAGDDVIILRGTKDKEICLVKDVKLIGAYNLENVTAAATASHLAGASVASIKKTVTSFTGLPHRLQFVAEKNGVRYYDDSKATTPDSTIAAVLSFDEPITLIVGGSSKGADYQELVREVMSSSVETIIGIGDEGKRLATMLREAGASQEIVTSRSTMVEIVNQAAKVSQPGSVVLLSPGAASFDMFINAEDRGNKFQQEVLKLAS